jgi:hypothetical protein
MFTKRWVQVTGFYKDPVWMSILFDPLDKSTNDRFVMMEGGQIRLHWQITDTSLREVPVIPPWVIDYRLGDETFQQEEQGHGWHGYFEPGKENKPEPSPNIMADMGPPPVDLDDPSWQTNGEKPDAGAVSQCMAQAYNGGFTIDMRDGHVPQDGHGVGGWHEPLNLGTTDPIEGGPLAMEYAAQYPELQTDPSMFLGGWRDNQGNLVVEVSKKIDDPHEAAQVGMDNNQEGIWDNAQGILNQQEELVKGKPDPETGKYKDGTSQTSAFIATHGTGVFGAVNPYTVPGVAQGIPKVDPTYIIVSYKGYGDGRISPAIGEDRRLGKEDPRPGREDSGSAGMSQGWQDKAGARLEVTGMPDRATMDDNNTSLLDRASAQAYANGKTDWPRLNAEAIKIEHETNGVVEAYQAAGVIAALSPRTPLGSEVGGAHFLSQAVATNMVMHFDPQALADYNAGIRVGEDKTPCNIQNDTALLSQPTRDDAASAVMLYSTQQGLKEPEAFAIKNKDGSLPGLVWTGKVGVGKAIEIACGFKFAKDGPLSEVVATPDNILGNSGPMKERDMFNNIINPSDALSTTVDGWMVGAAKGSGAYTEKMTLSEKTKENTELYKAVMSAPQSVKDNHPKGAGCYPIFVDSIATAAQRETEKTGVTCLPDEAQAIEWEVLRDEANGVPTPAGSITPNVASPGSSGKSDAVSSSTSPIVFPNAVATRALMSKAATNTAFAKQYPGIDRPDNLWAVKCSDGTFAFAAADREMDALIASKGDLTNHDFSDGQLVLPEKADIQTALSTVADLHERDPLNWGGNWYTNAYIGKDPSTTPIPPMITLRGPAGTLSETGWAPATSGIQGWTSPSTPGQICVNACRLSQWSPVSQAHPMDNWHMPCSSTVPTPQYTMTHEYGHLVEFSTQKEFGMPGAGTFIPRDVKATFVAANRYDSKNPANSPNFLSAYGKSNAHEGYAECYTEISIAGPNTTNGAAKVYDRVFNWSGTHPDAGEQIQLPDKTAQDFLSGAGPDSPGTVTINKENHD